ncbi:hypothetical protein BQ8794_90074 [Mesorhizobium prunaredense]|uniref:Uncharacterized protein n=1 Tax=Mesorhizobium prunaredense TaxID=1631249 RepID=A0A1R3VIZ8_9HYPH|nr:hypothetical protein BQ8794_90074 [Mesorhizobium prunaredense]
MSNLAGIRPGQPGDVSGHLSPGIYFGGLTGFGLGTRLFVALDD